MVAGACVHRMSRLAAIAAKDGHHVGQTAAPDILRHRRYRNDDACACINRDMAKRRGTHDLAMEERRHGPPLHRFVQRAAQGGCALSHAPGGFMEPLLQAP